MMESGGRKLESRAKESRSLMPFPITGTYRSPFKLQKRVSKFLPSWTSNRGSWRPGVKGGQRQVLLFHFRVVTRGLKPAPSGNLGEN
jgi:hypothetical protein